MILYKEEETSTDYKIIQITRHRFFRIRFRFFPQKKGEKKKKGSDDSSFIFSTSSNNQTFK